MNEPPYFVACIERLTLFKYEPIWDFFWKHLMTFSFSDQHHGCPHGRPAHEDLSWTQGYGQDACQVSLISRNNPHFLTFSFLLQP